MNLLISCIGRRGYMAEWFRASMAPGDRVIGTSNTRHTSAFADCDLAAVVPDIASDEYIPAMLDLCAREGVDGLLSFLDIDVLRLSPHLQRFRDIGVVPLLPEAPIAEMCWDKSAAARFLTGSGIEHPPTFEGLASARAAVRSGELTFPFIVKPRRGAGSRNTMLARTPRELEVFMGLEPEMIAQKRLGGYEIGIDVLNDLDGHVLSVVVKRNIKFVDGDAWQAMTIRHDAALEVAARVSGLLGQPGPLDLDAFVDGDTVTVLEMNPRFGGGYPYSHLAGADFTGKIVAMLKGRTVAADIGDYEEGVMGLIGIRVAGTYDGALSGSRGHPGAAAPIPP
jgi:carbamoyl-phosphate synthase large subunit